MPERDYAAPLPEEKVAALAERTCSAICEGDAPMGIPDAENPRHRIAACYEHHRTAQALAPLVAGWLAEAWDEGYADGGDTAWGYRNPYRADREAATESGPR